MSTDASAPGDAPDTARDVAVMEKDLPLHCPMPGAPLWARHPRVFLDVTRQGAVRCPYCGTHYTYRGAKQGGH